MILFLFIFLGLNSPASKEEHAIYISVLEIDRQEMKVKVFRDDLEDAIRNDSSSMDEYFRKKIVLQINEQPVSFSLKEVSEEGDSYWITFSLDTPPQWNSFYLEADYLMELFPDQTNVVKIMGQKPQYFKLSKTNPACGFD